MIPGDEDERALVEAAQLDPACFVGLYDRHFHRVWAYVIRRTGNHAEAEDITSEVFRKALESLPQYEWQGTPFIAWLLRIASNVVVTRWSRMARETGTAIEEVAEADADFERRAMLFELVDRLPDDQRRVIELRFIEGRNFVEIADRLGKTEGAIKQLQRRALTRLRTAWEASHA